MVCTGLVKSSKIEKLLDILENSLNFPQKSLNIFESSLNKNNFCLNKKHVLHKGMIESTAIHRFSLVISEIVQFPTPPPPAPPMSLLSAWLLCRKSPNEDAICSHLILFVALFCFSAWCTIVCHMVSVCSVSILFVSAEFPGRRLSVDR